MSDDGRIVCGVAVNGSAAAVALAAREADRTGCVLHLVHIRSPLSVDIEERALERARDAALDLAPRLVVTTEIVEDDWVAAALARAAEGARCLVLEKTGRGRLERILSGSTANGSAVLCTAPLLSVPTDWSPEAAARRPAVVTVAVQDVGEARDLVPVAATEAGAHDCELVVLHAVDHWDGADVADLLELADLPTSAGVRDADLRDRWVERTRTALAGVTGGGDDAGPAGPPRVEISHEAAGDALVAASAGSRLLVLGRRQRDRPWGTHVGPVVRRTLLDATCPVLLAPESDVRQESTPARQSLVAPVPSVPRPTPDSESLVPGDVMVAVGLGDLAGALRLAATEALQRGVGVHLVHVARAAAGQGASVDEAWHDAVDHGRLLLGSAAAGLRQLGGPGLRVTTALADHGGVVDTLVVEGSRASLIVLQHRRLGALRRLGTRSVTNGVAARTRVPVVGVPTGWTPGPDQGGCVLVGVQEPQEVPALLSVACAEALRRQVPVRVVHDPGRGDGSATAVRWEIERFLLTHPDVVVEPLVERSPLALLEAPMTAAQVAVLGRHHTALSMGSHLGPVARRALEVSRYPVLLVAVDPATAQEAASG